MDLPAGIIELIAIVAALVLGYVKRYLNNKGLTEIAGLLETVDKGKIREILKESKSIAAAKKKLSEQK